MSNVTIKRYSGDAWDTIYPKTTIGQVVDLSTALANLQANIDTKVGLSGNQNIAGTKNFTGELLARNFKLDPNGVPSSNLGGPSLAEMALFQEQFNNKTEFYNISLIKFYTSSDNINWTEITSFTDANKRIFVGGDGTTSGITIPNNTTYFRIEILNDGNYVYLNALYMYWQSSGHSSKVRIWQKPRNTQVWGLVTNSSASVSSWPGHLYLPFPTIPFHPSGTSHADAIRIEFENTWNLNSGTNPSGWNLPIYLHKMQIWGGYPAGKRTIYSVNEYKDVNFPSQIKEMNQRVYSPNNIPSLAVLGAAAATHGHNVTEIVNAVPISRTIAGITLGNDITVASLVAALTEATTSLKGLMSPADKSNLNTLVALLATEDSDSVVNTIGEVLQIFNNYPEGASLVTALSNKVEKVLGYGLSKNDFTDVLKAKLDAINYTASDVLSKLLTVDGSGSTIDADLLDGKHGSEYSLVTHGHGDISSDGKLSTQKYVGNGDALALVDSSDSNRLIKSDIVFDTTNTTQFLRKDGVFAIPPSPTLPLKIVKRLASNQSQTGTTLIDITGLSYALNSGKTYAIKIIGVFTSSIATSGLKLYGNFSGTGIFHGQSITTLGSLSSLNTAQHMGITSPNANWILSTDVVTTNASNLFEINVIATISNTGTFKLQFAAEAGTAAVITLIAGVSMIIEELTVS